MPRLSTILLGVAVVSLAGCGDGIVEPDLGLVSGIVTLDGTPVKEANILFRPVEGGRASHGTTDDSGAYELHFKRDMNGATVGKNQAIVTTRVYGGGQPGDADYVPPRDEGIPEKYHNGGGRSELIIDVEPGENVINLELKS